MDVLQVFSFGFSGNQLGELSRPASASYYNGWTIDAAMSNDELSWFVGDSSRDHCAGLLEGKPVGSFVVRESPVTGLMLCFVSKESYLRYDIEEMGIKEMKGRYALKGTGPPSKKESEQRSFSNLIIDRRVPKLPGRAADDRHRSVIAVADLGNDRVSLFSYIPPYKTLFPPRAKVWGFLDTRRSIENE